MKRRKADMKRLEQILAQIQSHSGDRRVAIGLLGHAVGLRANEIAEGGW
ncbi:MAG: hypothetical protein HY925_07020 [Elusimicrobia bacterium]|nr:hypothetical protein [Elusimicrobiota bacterium]